MVIYKMINEPRGILILLSREKKKESANIGVFNYSKLEMYIGVICDMSRVKQLRYKIYLMFLIITSLETKIYCLKEKFYINLNYKNGGIL